MVSWRRLPTFSVASGLLFQALCILTYRKKGCFTNYVILRKWSLWAPPTPIRGIRHRPTLLSLRARLHWYKFRLDLEEQWLESSIIIFKLFLRQQLNTCILMWCTVCTAKLQQCKTYTPGKGGTTCITFKTCCLLYNSTSMIIVLLSLILDEWKLLSGTKL